MICLDINLQDINNQITGLFKGELTKIRKEELHCCPHCGSKTYIKYGNYKNVQRYKCKNEECKKTFSLATNSLWEYSKKDLNTWMSFVRLMFEKRSLRYISQKLEISLSTAFYWRHKVMKALMKDDEKELVKKYVHIITTRMRENFKGCRKIATRRRKLIWIVTAKDINDKIISSPICKSRWDDRAFRKKIYSKIDKKAYLRAYPNRFIYAIAKKHNRSVGNKKDIIDNVILTFRARFANWFSDFRGIATKYLKDYLTWFKLFYKRKVYNLSTIVKVVIKKISYIKTNDIGKKDFCEEI
ncbi:MAG: IS1 family transposase [Clostridium sp.]|nr:IS1 family transposase [Clostridium sp.]